MNGRIITEPVYKRHFIAIDALMIAKPEMIQALELKRSRANFSGIQVRTTRPIVTKSQ